MIRRTPCEYYLKYLLVHPDSYSTDDIKLALREHQLDFPGDIPVSRLRERLVKPATFRPADKRHSATFRFLVREGIYYLFHLDDETRAAIFLLKRPRAKEMIEAMTIAGDPISFILHRLKAMGIKVTEKALQRYLFYFWNLELVDRTELHALMQMRVSSMATDGEDLASTLRHKAMQRAAYNDPRMVALNSPVPAFAGIFNQMRTGYMPPPIDLPTVMSRVREIMILRSAESGLDRGPMAARNSLDFSGAAKNVHELLEAIGTPDDELKRDLTSLLLAHSDAPVPTIHQLTHGEHTVDVQPTTEHVVK